MSSMGSSVTSGLGDGGRGSKHLPLAIVTCAVQDLGYSLQLKIYRNLTHILEHIHSENQSI